MSTNQSNPHRRGNTDIKWTVVVVVMMYILNILSAIEKITIKELKDDFIEELAFPNETVIIQ